MAFLIMVLPVILFFALQKAARGRSGKRKLGLHVSRVDGRALPLGRALVRSFAKFLPWQIAPSYLPHPRLAAQIGHTRASA